MSAEAPLAVVTGAAGGLGTAIAARLRADGRRLLLVDCNVDVERDAGFGGEWCRADLTAPQDVASVVERARALGGLSVLVNNAGITRDARIGDLDEAAFSAVIDVNLVSAMRLTLALEEVLREGAAVINISSRAGLGNFGQANYVASKAGLVGFTRALALRWAPRVRVNAVAPGLIDTPMTQAMPEAVLSKLVGRIPAQRIGAPADVANAVAHLAAPTSGYVTGQLHLVCGGRSVGR